MEVAGSIPAASVAYLTSSCLSLRVVASSRPHMFRRMAERWAIRLVYVRLGWPFCLLAHERSCTTGSAVHALGAVNSPLATASCLWPAARFIHGLGFAFAFPQPPPTVLDQCLSLPRRIEVPPPSTFASAIPMSRGGQTCSQQSACLRRLALDLAREPALVLLSGTHAWPSFHASKSLTFSASHAMKMTASQRSRRDAG